jgi:hypothetical protein
MKKIFFLPLAAVALFFSACTNNKTKGTTITSEDGKEKVTIDTKDMQQASVDMQKTTEELQKLTPLTMDQLKALVPESLMGVKRTNYSATSYTGAGMVSAEYALNDSSNIKVMVYDCAGQAGAGIYSMQYLGMMNIQSESDDEYTKTIDFNGGKAYEHCQKSTNDCTLTYFTGKRFLVSLDGNHVDAGKLKEAAGNLNIK